jgi:hypothetical protein
MLQHLVQLMPFYVLLQVLCCALRSVPRSERFKPIGRER